MPDEHPLTFAPIRSARSDFYAIGDDLEFIKTQSRSSRTVGVSAAMIGRLIGWAIFLVGLLVLARDALVSIETRHWAPITLGQLWYDFNPVSEFRFRLTVEHPFLWNSIIVTILLCWTFVALMVLGIVILAISSWRRRVRARESLIRVVNAAKG
jgi:ABC-type Fe3+ transport system permease subunit